MTSEPPRTTTDPDVGVADPATAVTGARTAPGLAGLDPIEGAPVDLGRWRLLQRIGSGGMGVVYRAEDVERGGTVAVKALHRTDPGGLLRLKAEFRSVADVAHENLVMLHELVVDGDQWFFVMEYVEGVGLLEHVRGERHAAISARELERARQAETLVGGGAALADWSPPVMTRELDAGGIQRLRTALRQLVLGVAALHRAGKLHRDLKPSNVLVEATGRVVVLDFGLVTDETVAGVDLHGPAAGTPAYMAPEQAMGRPATIASDWYAVGVMLFEALTGHLPFRGTARDILESKMHHEAFPPSATVPSVPTDLDALCHELLRIDPAARPSTDDILQRLGVEPPLVRGVDLVTGARPWPPAPTAGSAAEHPVRGDLEGATIDERSRVVAMSGARRMSPSSPQPPSSEGDRESPPPPPPPRVIGRGAELAVLDGAFRDAAAGAAVAVLVDGVSGVGKTALVRSFADSVRRQEGALVLEGRCYERESVPYKAFDALVDALERELGDLPRHRLAELLPPGLAELARIFPVLREVAAMTPEGVSSGRGPDPQELQARAFRCLKLLLARIAGTRPLVLVIDDLQWGDGDSGRLLAELLAPPERPALLLVCTYRSDEAETPLLRSIVRGELIEGVRTLHVDPLDPSHAAQLARSLLGSGGDDPAAAAIAREAEGSPFFVEQLVRYAEAGGSASVSLAGLLVARVGQLPPDARRLLEVIAVAGRPIEQGVAAVAAALPDARPALALLRTGSLVRTRGTRERDAVEAYHDRVRVSVAGQLGAADRAAVHLALAGALAATGRADPRDLAHHLHAGGDAAGAYHHAVRAADEAAIGLAFDRAAELYGLALACDRGTAAERASLQERQADALVHAGRCAEAAPLYLAASSARDGRTAWDLRRRAAEQVLVSGDIDAGVRVLRPVLADVGLPFPRSPRSALAAVVARILQIEVGGIVRGPRGALRGARDVPAIELARLDVCWSAGKGLLSVDPARAAYFFVRSVIIALEAGEPSRLARSLAIYGMMQVFEGDERGHARGSRRLDEAEALARTSDDPYLHALIDTTRGTAAMSIGRWREGLDLMERGIALFEGQCTGVAWEVGTARSSCFNTRLWLGEVKVIAETAPAWHRTGVRVGNRFTEVTSDLYTAFGELAHGQAAAAGQRVRQAIARWTRDGYHFQHWLAHKVEVWCHLYEGRPESAWSLLESVWPALEESKLLRVQLMTIDCRLLRGLVAAATAGRDPSRLALAAREAEVLAGLGRPTAAAAAQLLRSQIALARGQVDDARALLDAAATAFDAADVRLHAECARRRLGELRGGDMGRALVARVDRWMESQGIADPARFSAVFAPVPAGRAGVPATA